MDRDPIDRLIADGEEVTMVLRPDAKPEEVVDFWARVERYMNTLPVGSVLLLPGADRPTVVVKRGGGRSFVLRNLARLAS